MNSILALDIGTVRTGVARAYEEVGLASPFTVITSNDDFVESVKELVMSESAVALVVGLPRSLESAHTQQTEYVQNQITALESALDIPIYTVDEALTSVQAEKELAARKKPYEKQDIDMLSATYILEDYLRTKKVGS